MAEPFGDVYPVGTRVRIEEDPGEWMGIQTATPEESKPHLGRTGTIVAYECLLGDPSFSSPKIELDGGAILWGYECWWSRLDDDRRRHPAT